jgi:hypothetical protein
MFNIGNIVFVKCRDGIRKIKAKIVYKKTCTPFIEYLCECLEEPSEQNKSNITEITEDHRILIDTYGAPEDIIGKTIARAGYSFWQQNCDLEICEAFAEINQCEDCGGLDLL